MFHLGRTRGEPQESISMRSRRCAPTLAWRSPCFSSWRPCLSGRPSARAGPDLGIARRARRSGFAHAKSRASSSVPRRTGPCELPARSAACGVGRGANRSRSIRRGSRSALPLGATTPDGNKKCDRPPGHRSPWARGRKHDDRIPACFVIFATLASSLSAPRSRKSSLTTRPSEEQQQ